jgi:hypothetical protein
MAKKIKSDVSFEQKLSLANKTASRALILDGSGEVTHSATTSTEIGYVSGVTSGIQSQINSKANASDLTTHESDTSTHGVGEIVGTSETQTLENKTIDADNNTISNIANANIKTGAAIAEAKLSLDFSTSSLNTAISNHISDASDAHDASAISNVPSGNLAATDVQAALDELQSDVDSRALDSAVIKKDGSVAYTGNQAMGGNKITGLGAPTAGSDAATKQYVDNAIEGAKPKQAVRVATTANIDLSQDLENGDSIDGITLATGDRVLVKNQTDAEDNGIYVVVASGAASRSTDFDSLSPVDEINKAYVAVQEGTANAGKIFIQYGTVTTLGTDDINFTFYNSISGLVGGDGITVSGSNISVDHDGQGLAFSADQLVLELDGSTLSKSASGLKVADNGITATQINTDAVTTTKIQNSAVTGEKIADNVVDEGHLTTSVAGAGLTGGNGSALTVDIPGTTAETVNDNADLILIYDDSASALRSMTRGDFLDGISFGSAGDLVEASASLSDNQGSAANVTGFAFANATVRSFEAQVAVIRGSTYEKFQLEGIQKGASWDLYVESIGDNTGITFSINSSGQVQYTSTNTGSGATVKFRAETTTV